MQEVVFVTHNRGKVLSAQKYFDGIRLVTFDYELDEPRSDDLRAIDGSVSSLQVFADWYKENATE